MSSPANSSRRHRQYAAKPRAAASQNRENSATGERKGSYIPKTRIILCSANLDLKTSLDEKQILPMKLGRFLIDLLEEDPEDHEKLLQATTIDKLFQLISSYYCFLNTAVLGDIIDKFIGEPLKHQLEEYEHQLEQFKESTSMSLLQEIGPQCSPSVGAPQVTIKLAKCWQRVTIKRFQRLVERSFEENSTRFNITVTGCITQWNCSQVATSSKCSTEDK